jgi:hypothetical protein
MSEDMSTLRRRITDRDTLNARLRVELHAERHKRLTSQNSQGTEFQHILLSFVDEFREKYSRLDEDHQKILALLTDQADDYPCSDQECEECFVQEPALVEEGEEEEEWSAVTKEEWTALANTEEHHESVANVLIDHVQPRPAKRAKFEAESI